MQFSLRRALVFTAQFLPLFLLCLWVYWKALPAYQPVVFGAANAITRSLPSPSAIEIQPEGGWWAYGVTADGSKSSIDSWPAYMAHLLFLSLALLPALILATPAPLPARLRLLLIGLLLLFAVHVLSVIGLVRQTQCLVVRPGSFHCLWILRLVYGSGQISGALLWGLLTWRYWFPRRGAQAAAGSGPGGAVALTCLALALSGMGCARPGAEPPNIVVLVVDTLRADHLGTHGFPGDISPALDRLAGEALVFDNAFAQSPWTKPSTASLFTSLYPQVHRVTTHEGEDWGGLPESGDGGSKVLPPQAVTLAEVLRDHGYRTAAFVANPFISAHFGFDQGFDSYDVRLEYERNRAEHLVAAARAWLVARDPGQPFFLYLHFMDVHAPYDAPQADYRALEGSASADGRVLRPDQMPDRRFHNIEVRPTWATAADRRRVDYWRTRYASGVRKLDREVGALLSFLADNGLDDSTIVVLTSDHGEELFEHGSWSHGFSFYEHQLRVPLFVRVPAGPDGPAGPGVTGGTPRGRRTTEMIEGVDVMPTLLAAAGIPAADGLQGRDLSALLRGDAIDGGEYCFAGASLAGGRSHALRSRDHKLILDLDSGLARLYDLAADPGEQTDIAGTDPELTTRLSTRLLRHLDESVADGVLEAEAAEIPADVLKSIEALGYVDR